MSVLQAEGSWGGKFGDIIPLSQKPGKAAPIIDLLFRARIYLAGATPERAGAGGGGAVSDPLCRVSLSELVTT